MAETQAIVEIIGRQSVSGPAGVAAAALSSVEAAAGKAGSVLGGLATATAKAGLALGAIAATGAIAGLTAATTAAAGFEKEMSAVGAVSGASAQQMKDMSALALKLGADTSFSASQSAQGIEELVKAGVSVADVMGGAAKASLDLAAAGGVDVATAAEIASNAMNVFGIKGKDMAHVADEIAGAANASAIDVNDYKFSLAAAGAVAATVGVNFDDLSTAIAVMGQAGIKGSDAGTSLKTMLLNLTPSTKQQIAEAKELGIVTADGANKFFDASGKAKSMAEIAQVLQTATKGLTEEQRLQALQTLFGTDAIRAAAIMAKAGSAGFTDMAAAIGKVSAADVANTRLDNLAGSIEKFRGSAETASITVGQHLTPPLRRLVDIGTDLLNGALPALDRFGTRLGAAFDGLITRAQGAGPALAGVAGTVLALGRYFRAVADDGDYLNDHLTEMPRRLAVVVEAVGHGLVTAFTAARGAITEILASAGPTIDMLLHLGRDALPLVRDAATAALPALRMVGQFVVDYVTNNIRFLTTYILPAFHDVAVQTFGFLKDEAPVFSHIAGVLREQLGVTLIWLADEVWPNLISMARQTVEWFDRELLPLIPPLADALRVTLGEALYWLSTTGWPAMLGAATVAIHWLTDTGVPAITSLVEWLGPKLRTALTWVAQTGWPALLSAASAVIDWTQTTALPALSALVDWLGPKISASLTWIAQTGWPSFLAAASDVATFVTGTVVPAVSGLVSWLADKIPPAVAAVLSAFEAVRSRLAPVIQAVFGGDISTALAGLGSAFADFASLAIGWLSDQAARIDWASVWATAKDVTLKMADWFVDVATRFAGWISDEVAKINWADVWSKAVDVAEKMGAWFVDLATKLTVWIGDQVSKIDWTAVWNQITGMTEAMAAAFSDQFKKIDWLGIFNAALDAEIKLYQWITDMIGKVDWAKVGENLGKYIGDMFVAAGDGDIDWTAIATKYAGLIGSMLGTAIAAHEAWDAFKQGLIDGFVKAVTGISLTDAETALGNRFLDMLKNAWNAATGGWSPSLPNVFGGGGGGSSGSTVQNQSQQASSAPLTSVDTSSRDANMASWAPRLRALQQQTGLSASALWAIIQAENGGGQSDLSANGNNYFSISAAEGRPHQTGAREGTPGYGLSGRFAQYQTPEDSLQDFVDLIQNSPRYADAWANRGDPSKFFQGLVKGGYIVDEPGFPTSGWLTNLQSGVDTFNSSSAAQDGKTNMSATTTTGSWFGGFGTHSQSGNTALLTQTQQQWDQQAQDANAICGPYLASLFASTVGRPPTADEARFLAEKMGIYSGANGGSGILDAGAFPDLANALIQQVNPGSGVRVQQSMGLSNGEATASAADSLASGEPLVGFNTQNHYFGADQYDPATGKFHVGGTGLSLAGGSDWMSVDEMTAKMGPLIGVLTEVGNAADASTTAVTPLAPSLSDAADAATAVAPAMQDAATAAGDLPGPLQDVADQADTTGAGFLTLSDTIGAGLGQASDAVDTTAGAITSAVAGMGDDVLTSVTQLGDDTLTTLQDGMGNVIGVVTDAAGNVVNQFVQLGPDSAAGLATGDPAIRAAVGQWGSGMLASLEAARQQAVGEAQNVGQDVGGGIADGIDQSAGDIQQSLSDALQGSLDDLSKSFEIHSPSGKTRREIGRPLGHGIALGIQDMSDTVNRAMRGVVALDGVSTGRVDGRGGSDGGIDYDRLAAAIVAATPNAGPQLTVHGAGTDEVVAKVLRVLKREQMLRGAR